MDINLLKNRPFFLVDEDIKWVTDTLAGMNEEEKTGQLFCMTAYISDEKTLKDFAQKYRAGGVMARPMDTNESLMELVSLLQKNSKIPMLIAANLEAGANGVSKEATRIGTQMAVAATGDPKYAGLLGEVCGSESAALGCNWAFAPVIDIDFNFRNPITNTRTYGNDWHFVKRCGIEYVRALQKHGVAASIKHFPGDGCDERDQHLVTSINDLSVEEWDRTYGEVYRACIEAGALTLMAGHILQPAYSRLLKPGIRDEDILPASLSGELLNGLLRKKLSFNGLIVTDATTMAGFNIPMERRRAVPQAINAGCDMFLFTRNLEEDYSFMADAVNDKVISPERLNDAVTRILGLKAALGLHRKNNLADRKKVKAVVASGEHKDWTREIADRSITLAKNIQDALPVTPEKYRSILFYSIDPVGESVAYGPSNASANQMLVDKLKRAGFEVTVWQPDDAFGTEGMLGSSEAIKNKYDLIIYSSNLATKSNQTTVRIEWAQPMGANVPVYVNSVPTIFIGFENPYHLLDTPRVKTLINTYGSSKAVIDALVEKLMGISAFTGTSPVDVFLGKWDTRL
ncbi:MAG: glycosyl hydrolase [Treponema sp.]|jgi:beta-N-acetylhexosaminidase|nr:glycosyl hydrolase [Treponema sp.]